MSVIICLVSCPSQEVATSIAKELVEQGLAACVNIVPGMQSIYRWQGSLCSSEEALLIIKSTLERQEELKSAVLSMHPYELPEFIALSPSAISEPYAEWVSAGVKRSI